MPSLRERIARLETGGDEWIICRTCPRCGELVVGGAPWTTPCGEHPPPPPLRPGDRVITLQRSYGEAERTDG